MILNIQSKVYFLFRFVWEKWIRLKILFLFIQIVNRYREVIYFTENKSQDIRGSSFYIPLLLHLVILKITFKSMYSSIIRNLICKYTLGRTFSLGNIEYSISLYFAEGKWNFCKYIISNYRKRYATSNIKKMKSIPT